MTHQTIVEVLRDSNATGAGAASRQAQHDRIAQDLLASLQRGLQGVDIEQVLAATMVKVRYCFLSAMMLGTLSAQTEACALQFNVATACMYLYASFLDRIL